MIKNLRSLPVMQGFMVIYVNSERKYFIPRCVKRGPGSGFESLSAAGGVCKSGILPPWDCDQKHGFRIVWLITGQLSGSWAEIESVYTYFSRSIFTFLLNNHESVWNLDFQVGELLQDLGFFKTQWICGNFENRTQACFQNLKSPKLHVPSIRNELILS